MALISTTTPLSANGVFTSSVVQTTRATQITGTVFADEGGSLKIQQSGDGVNFDVATTISVTASAGQGIEVDVLEQYIRVQYTNGGVDQATFRLYVDLRDPYGDFLLAAEAPTAGGAWLVLVKQGTDYQVVGRFDGIDGWNANGNAALSRNKSGTYASFPVVDATVTQETLQQSTVHTPEAF